MKKWLKRIGIGLGTIVVLLLLFVVTVNGVSAMRQRAKYRVNPVQLPPASDFASIARGRHLVTAVAKCGDCHGADLGGNVMDDNALFGRLVASNLTRGAGGIGGSYTDHDYVRAIRHGVARDSGSLIFMPAEAFQRFSDADLASIIAYLKTVPPVDRTLPPIRIGPVARMLHVLAGLPLLPAEVVDHNAKHDKPDPSDTLAHGEYLTTTGGCAGCHGRQLTGGGGGGPDITKSRLPSWTEADFFRSLREGKRPDGTAISEMMPWKSAGKMTDDEIRAVWRYIRSLPGKAT